jgi:hypothetical protein
LLSYNENKITKELVPLAGFLLLAAIMAFIIKKGEIAGAGFFIVLPFILAFLIWVFRDPKVGVLSILHFSFLANGLGRFLPGAIPFGLFVDALLVLTIVATMFKVSKKQAGQMFNPLFYILFVWFLYTLFELVNPEARSKEAWFYAVRGVSLYQIQLIPLVFILMNKREDMEQIIRIWFIWSLVAAFYGFKMNIFGVTGGERKWLDEGGKITHEIHGRLRIFSFYSDAGQFGAAMAHTTICALLLAIGPYSKKEKYFYWFVTAVCFWGYALSGSRGPLFVLAAGGFLYLFLIGNFRILLIGAMIGGVLFGILKYTHIGDGNYQIHRMRTGLDPNDASLQVRIENQKKLAVYLSSRPMGGGIGSGGNWGARFTPGSFLSQVALDSWYVKIWVETGIIGLLLHIATLIIILIYGMVNVFRLKNPDLRQKMIALVCGYFGIAMASYGNQILGQMPTGMIIYFSMVYMFLCVKWDKEWQEQQNIGNNQPSEKNIENNLKPPFEVGTRLGQKVRVKIA